MLEPERYDRWLAYFDELLERVPPLARRGKSVDQIEKEFPPPADMANWWRFVDWKHRRNPFGVSPAWVAVDGSRVVGFRTFLEARIRFPFRSIYWFFDTFSYKSYLLLPRNLTSAPRE